VSAPEWRNREPGADTQVCPYVVELFFKDHNRAEQSQLLSHSGIKIVDLDLPPSNLMIFRALFKLAPAIL
jgi:hypothetical protein